MTSLRTRHAALVGRGAIRIPACIDGGTACQKGMGLSEASVICQRTQLRVSADDITVDAICQLAGIGGVFDQVVCRGGT
jgi:hypothetical protein